MVHLDVELLTFEEVSEVTYSHVHSKEFSAESAVACLHGSELPRKEGEKVPVIIHNLLQDHSDSSITCITHEAK